MIFIIQFPAKYPHDPRVPWHDLPLTQTACTSSTTHICAMLARVPAARPLAGCLPNVSGHSDGTTGMHSQSEGLCGRGDAEDAVRGRFAGGAVQVLGEAGAPDHLRAQSWSGTLPRGRCLHNSGFMSDAHWTAWRCAGLSSHSNHPTFYPRTPSCATAIQASPMYQPSLITPWGIAGSGLVAGLEGGGA